VYVSSCGYGCMYMYAMYMYACGCVRVKTHVDITGAIAINARVSAKTKCSKLSACMYVLLDVLDPVRNKEVDETDLLAIFSSEFQMVCEVNGTRSCAQLRVFSPRLAKRRVCVSVNMYK
jgi:hypothetical protein